MNRSVYITTILLAGSSLLHGCSDNEKKAGKEMKGMVMHDSRNKDTLNLSSVLKPANEFVLTSIATTTIRRETINPVIDALGNVAYDIRQVGTISSKVSGRIDKLYLKYSHQEVHKGDRVMDIYSPELATAQENLLFLLKNDPDNNQLINDARQRLLLMGMDDKQLRQITVTRKAMLAVPVFSNYSGHIHEAGMNAGQSSLDQMAPGNAPLSVKEGAYIQKGQPVFDVYNHKKSWILLNIYPGDQKKVSAGSRVDIVPEAGSDVIHGIVNYIEPFFMDNKKTLTARVYLDNSAMMLPIGSQVRAKIHTAPRTENTLPETAVLSLGLNQIVFKKTKDGFSPVKVVVGERYEGRIVIRSGLTQSDTVAANGQFLMDSESFIKITKQ